ncbi:unnamed protein product [Fusarium fujikuroi]|uniref:Nephrocystin 3-like N-terminal domain-containing protein n=1 Tax=Fusarium fujikuroi TaxID=5127 RepID=A0A9Q9RAG0_FUSFU|nr:unnamed protein product [Fusarium fujikuroi]VZH98921.1 unnamed protein product [Fusarium fujikuroi]
MNALQAVFAEMAQSIGELWIVIDALDECSADERSARVLPWVKGISHSEQFNTHILVTSRPELDIEKGITAWGRSKYATLVANKLIAEDIYAYVKAKVRDPQSKLMERWKQRDDILNKVETVLLGKANGMFLWVSCQLRMLEDCLDSRRLYEKLNLLPTTLNGTYDRILKDIARHPHMKDGIRVLQMLMFSRSRLTLEQAVDAIAVDTERRPYFEMENRMPDPLDLLSCLSGLVNTVKHGGELVLQLAHFSVKEYLTSEQLPTEFRKPLQEIVARTSIAETCLAYRLDLRRNIECCADLSPRLRELAPLKRQRELQHQISTSGWLGTLDQPDALVEAAGLGLACPITALLERNTDNEVRGRALEAASRNGHKKIVRLLLENGAQINMHDKHYGTPLISALMGGQIGVAQLLLDSGADINAQAGTFGTALQTASSSGDLHCVQTLLDYHADVNVLGGNFGSALQAACYNRHESVTRMLLEAGADPNIWGYGDYLKIKSGSALYIASIKGCPDIVQLLVDYGADVNALGGLDGSALQVAAMLGHEEVVEVLLGCDNIDLDARGGYHGTALRAALYAKHQSIVDSLIEHGAQMDNKTAATVAENREAQRRSRARRNELIADLQSRLKEYERTGVTASIEMQRVAQAVNVQNQRLKNLLGVYGVSEDEIEQYLSSPEQGDQALNAQHRCNTCGRLLSAITQTRDMSTDDPSQSSFESALSMAGDAVPTLASVLSSPTLSPPGRKQPSSTEPPIEPIQHRENNEGVFMLQEEEQGFHHQMHTANGLDNTTADNSSFPIGALSPFSDSFDTFTSIIHSSNQLEPLETSCDKAAKILMELHNHTDSSWARLALGCYEDSCYVKNTIIFQLMDSLE